jgi:serine/threonine-protein kinase
MIGTTLGHFRIVEKLGAGGMGEVYRARDEQLQRDVALKVLSAKALPDQTARARLLQEARAASALNHPHICTIHEVGEAGGQAYIVMERVEGRPLKELIPAGGLPVEAVLRYGAQIADALDHAHERGIIHRDLKTLNVVVTPAGQVKVLDFGLAKRLSGSELDEATRSQKSLTAAGAIVGTLTYMAPEVLRGEPADARSDIWALGVVLYEMAAGQMPFRGQTGFELSSAILREPPAPLAAGVPSGLRAIIQRCLAKEPGQRYQRTGEIRAVLEAIEPASSSAAAPATQSAAAPPWQVPGRTKRGRIWLGGAAGLVGLLGLAFALNIGGLRGRLLGPAPHAQIQSLAVIPLTNFSGDPEQEYFADGMTEELITDLAKIGALKVISRTSVMQYKGTKKTVPEIARELNVDGIVEGSVQRSGDRVRITAQLIEARTDRHIWAESYERDLRDVLGLQGEVASAIAREIRVTLTPQEQTRLASARPVNPEAHEAYLKGLYHWNKLTEEEVKKSIEYFQRAIQLAPDYAPAFAALAFSYNLLASSGQAAPQENYLQAKNLAQKALELDENLADAHAALGFVLCYSDWEWRAAEAEFKRAIVLNPNSDTAHAVYALYLGDMGRSEEAIAEMKKSLESNPLSVLENANLAWLYWLAGQPEKAVEQYHVSMEMDANSPDAHEGLGWIYAVQGKHEEALAEWRKAIRLSENAPGSIAGLAGAYAAAGKKSDAHKLLSELEQMSKRRYVSPYQVAGIYASLGEREQTFRLLGKALKERDPLLIDLKVDPNFASLRSDPRFAELLRRVGLPPHGLTSRD